MKKLLIGSLLLTASFITTTASANNYIDPGVEQELIKICGALKNNNKLKLRNLVKKSRLGYKNIANGLVCNGQEAVKFALLNGADKTANMLANKAGIDIDNYLTKL